MTTLVIIGLIGLTLAAYLTVVSQQNLLTMRSQVWASEIPLAEAGIEEAIAHMNSQPGRFDTEGWTRSGRYYVRMRTLGDGYYYAMISTTAPPAIVSIGFGRVPTQTNYTHRTVMVMSRPSFYGCGLLSKNPITQVGAVVADSFDSSNPLYSTGGQYDPAKRHDQVVVASLSGTPGAVNVGNANIYGSVATAPGGTVLVGANGVVGDLAYAGNKADLGTIEAGHTRNDLNATISDVGVPFTGGYMTPSSGNLGGTNYTYLLGQGDYQSSALNVGNGTMLVTGKARLYVKGTFTVGSTAEIVLAPGASLEVFVDGPDVNVGGKGVVNLTGLAKNFTLYGLPTCTSVAMGGNSTFIGTVYAPEALVSMKGNPVVIGAVVGNSIDMTGTADFHFDESLSPPGETYRIANWEEI